MWIHRKEHFRNASSAPERSKVAATVYYRPDTAEPPPRQGWDERCPHCDAPIRVMKPERGGTAVLNACSPDIAAVRAAAAKGGLAVLTFGGPGADIAIDEARAEADGQSLRVTVTGVGGRVMLPLVGVVSPRTMFMMVVLPAP